MDKGGGGGGGGGVCVCVCVGGGHVFMHRTLSCQMGAKVLR